jgi:hypothetical protein
MTQDLWKNGPAATVRLPIRPICSGVALLDSANTLCESARVTTLDILASSAHSRLGAFGTQKQRRLLGFRNVAELLPRLALDG